jgi:fructose-bisphosphate aldolase, class I
MMHHDVASVARMLVAGGRGILAIDEPVKICNARFQTLGIEPSSEQRRAYRELLITAPRIERFISGMILYDETIRQKTREGERFVDALRERGIVPGIKVDLGTSMLPFTAGETITEGLDGLRSRLTEYAVLGAGFAKWRAVFRITGATPSDGAIHANAHALARYAALCQESGLVPIVEPEVLADGDHELERCAEVTERVLAHVFAALEDQGAALKGIVLKPNMVTPGLFSRSHAALERIAAATLGVLGRTVPPAVAGIAFLSGGQDERTATERLCAVNRAPGSSHPWPLTFSFGRALQYPALRFWRGRRDRVPEAQRILVRRAYCNSLAACGEYEERFETAPIEELIRSCDAFGRCPTVRGF